MPRLRFSPLLSLLALVACSRAPAPAERVVHEERALAKANAAWASVFSKTADATYSAENIRRFSPYSATLENGTWEVRSGAPADRHGRAPQARIRADDGSTRVSSVDR